MYKQNWRKLNLKGIYSEKMYYERRLLELLAASLQPEKQVLWEFLLYNIIAAGKFASAVQKYCWRLNTKCN